MEFTITCPIDGPVEVGLEDIETVVLKDSDRADITFNCPECGTRVTVTAVVPAFLLSAIEALSGEPDMVPLAPIEPVVGIDEPKTPRVASVDEPRIDAYCEYFRRQLSHTDCVEDAVAEMDSPARS